MKSSSRGGGVQKERIWPQTDRSPDGCASLRRPPAALKTENRGGRGGRRGVPCAAQPSCCCCCRPGRAGPARLAGAASHGLGGRHQLTGDLLQLALDCTRGQDSRGMAGQQSQAGQCRAGHQSQAGRTGQQGVVRQLASQLRASPPPGGAPARSIWWRRMEAYSTTKPHPPATFLTHKKQPHQAAKGT